VAQQPAVNTWTYTSEEMEEIVLGVLDLGERQPFRSVT
jgi:hypothetical protein